jgi:hypothetical protein
VDAAVLGEAALGDVHAGHDLDAAGDGGVHLEGWAEFFGETAVDAVADAEEVFAGLDVDVAGAVLDGGVNAVVDELDDGGVAGHLLDAGDVLDGGVVDDGELVGIDVVDDVIDDEDGLVGEIGLEGGADVADGGGDDLDLIAAEALDLFDEEDVCGLGYGDGEFSLDEEEGEDLVLFEEFLGEDGDDLGVGDARADAGVGDAVGLGEGFGDLIFGAEAELDEDFAEELLVVGAALLVEGALELFWLEKAPVQEKLTERFSLESGDHNGFISSFSGLRGGRGGTRSGVLVW